MGAEYEWIVGNTASAFVHVRLAERICINGCRGEWYKVDHNS